MYLTLLLTNYLAFCLLCLLLLSTFKTTSAAPSQSVNPFKSPADSDYSEEECSGSEAENPFLSPDDPDNHEIEVSGCEESESESEVDIKSTDDGPTSDRSPGIGVEFESNRMIMSNKDCIQTNTWRSKGKVVEGRTGNDWSLTVDTSSSVQGELFGEYIMNGKTIKIGTGRAGLAAGEIKEDLVRA